MDAIGRVEALFRYPVKSMAGEPLTTAELGWQGIEGDRRFGIRRVEERGGFPWLTASKLPELLRFHPIVSDGRLTHARAPDGRELAVEELVAEIARLHGRPVELMQMKHGIFDEASLSVIGAATVEAIAPDVRRFRPNVLIRTDAARAFEEDGWIGAILGFGDDGPEVSITLRDERCVMVNLDPDSAESDPQVLKAVARMNDVHAGVYGTVVRRGRLAVGQLVRRVR